MDCENSTNESCTGDTDLNELRINGSQPSQIREKDNGSWQFKITSVDDDTDHFELVVSAIFHQAKQYSLATVPLCNHCKRPMSNADLKMCEFSILQPRMWIKHYHKTCANALPPVYPVPAGHSDMVPLMLRKHFDSRANIVATTLVASGNIKRFDPLCPLRLECKACKSTDTAGLAHMNLEFGIGKIAVLVVHEHCQNNQG